MKLSPDRLSAALKEGRLAPVYLIAGDEPLLVTETADAVRAAAREQGYADREVFFAERGFDWGNLTTAGASLSLFAARRILEIRLPSGKPGNGADALTAYAQTPAPDTILLVIAGKLERGGRGAKWVNALDKAGVFVQVRPLERTRLPAWISARMRARGLEPTRDAVNLLADRVEGNLLAASQEIEKLLMARGPGRVDMEALQASVADSARFDLFSFVDTAVAGDARRALRMLSGLRSEGVEPVLIIWGLQREIRALAQMATEIDAGASPRSVLSHVWEKRRLTVKSGLERLKATEWRGLLTRAARADGVIKGQIPGRAWDELVELTAGVAGIRLAGFWASEGIRNTA